MPTDNIEDEILEWLNQSPEITSLLNFTIGPTSPLAVTHLYSSFRGERALTQYAMVSGRAPQLLVTRCGKNAIKAVYQHAAALQNPSFLGWVIDADLFDRATTGCLVWNKRAQGNEMPASSSRRI
jgi:hypothetical protein